jgi:Rieske Fe-S protein
MRQKKCASSGLNDASSDQELPYKISRRSFLGSSALVVLPAICGGCTDNGPAPVVLPAVTNNTIILPFADFAALTKTGGSIVGQAKGYVNPIVIARVRDDSISALDAICTHERCTVAYNALNIDLECPCHGSTYEVDGTVIGGPAPRPLRVFTVTFDATNVTITLS